MSKIYFCEFRSKAEAENAVKALKEKYKTNFYSFVVDGGTKFEGGAVNYSVDGLNYFSENLNSSLVSAVSSEAQGEIGASARLSFSDGVTKTGSNPKNDLEMLGAFGIKETGF